MALETFFIDVYDPPSISILATKMDRISFTDPMDHPVLVGFTKYFMAEFNYEYKQDRRSRNEIMPLHDSFARLDAFDVATLRNTVDALVTKYDEPDEQIYHFLRDNRELLNGMIKDKGRTYTSEAIRLVVQEIADLGVLG